MGKVVAWVEDADQSGVASNIAAVADRDQSVISSGDNLRLPPDYNYVYAAYGWTEFAAFPLSYWEVSQASIARHPLRMRNHVALNFLADGQVYDWRHNAYRLNTGEDTSCIILGDDEGGVAHFSAAVLFLATQPQAGKGLSGLPLTHVSASTFTGNSTSIVWSSYTPTQVNALDSGTYAILGARVIGITAIVARLILETKVTGERPPIIPVNAEEQPNPSINMDWSGKFTFSLPDHYPVLEYLSTAAEVPAGMELYLSKIA